MELGQDNGKLFQLIFIQNSPLALRDTLEWLSAAAVQPHIAEEQLFQLEDNCM